MNLFLQNLRYGLRKFRSNPGSMLVIILTLGIGIAVNNIFIGIINEFYCRPLPARNPQQLAIIAVRGPQVPFQFALSYADCADLRSFVEGSEDVKPDMANIFSGLMAYKNQVVHLSRPEYPTKRAWVDAVTDNYFSVLGTQPHMGRFFRPEEATAPGAERVIVLSYDSWKTQFDGDPDIVGSTVKLNGTVFTVIGVTQKGFMGASWGARLDGFIPITMLTKLENEWVLNRGNTCTFAMGRLQPGVSIQQAQAACDVAYARLNKANPYTYMPNSSLIVMRESRSRPSPHVAQHTPKIVAVLTAMGGLVLIIALFNATSLLYARSIARERELAIRAALGASRGQIMKQVLTESILLALAAGVFGTLLSQLLGPGLMELLPNPDMAPPELNTGIDWKPFVATTLVALVIGFFAGIMPARKAAGISPFVLLKNQSAGISKGKNRLRNLLLAGQLVISILVLSIAAMAVRMTTQLAHMELGFQKENLHLVSFDLGAQKYDQERGRQFHADLIRQVQALPGIEAASLTSAAPVDTTFGMLGGIRAEEAPDTEESYLSAVPTMSVESGYLDTIGLTLQSGRCFTVHDDSEAPAVAIINRTLADMLWPDKEALGQQIRIQGKVAEVVGIVETSRYYNITDTRRAVADCSARTALSGRRHPRGSDGAGRAVADAGHHRSRAETGSRTPAA